MAHVVRLNHRHIARPSRRPGTERRTRPPPPEEDRAVAGNVDCAPRCGACHVREMAIVLQESSGGEHRV
jgi:hypothetical protein